MADGKIYITITEEKKDSGGNVVNPETPQVDKKSEEKNNLLSAYAQHQVFNFIQSQAQQFMNYTIGNIGNFTGNYQSQRNIQETLRIGGMIKNVVVSTVTGAESGGVWGAVIGAVTSTASQVINLAYENKTLQVSTKQQNREIEMMRKLSGLDGLTNGSRWG